MAENTGRSGQPTQNPGGRLGTGAPSNSAARFLRSAVRCGAASRSVSRPAAPVVAKNFPRARSITSPVYSPAMGKTPVSPGGTPMASFPYSRVCTSARRRMACSASSI